MTGKNGPPVGVGNSFSLWRGWVPGRVEKKISSLRPFLEFRFPLGSDHDPRKVGLFFSLGGAKADLSSEAHFGQIKVVRS
jgi:hypothetical protein